MKNLLLILSLLLSLNTWSQNRSRVNYFFTDEWKKIRSSITDYNLEVSNIIPTVNLIQGLNFGPQVNLDIDDSNTNASIQLNSSVDTWSLNLAANNQLFGIKDIFGFNIGLGKSITYIQQHPTKWKAVWRWPYNPITRLPIKSEQFFKKIGKDSNEDLFKVGDFVSFQVPLSINISKSLASQLADTVIPNTNINFSLSGSYSVNILRMPENFVRVRISNMSSRTQGFNVGLNITDAFVPHYKILSFDLLGTFVNNTLFDSTIIRFDVSRNQSYEAAYDMIFNLNQTEARLLYDQLMSKKLSFYSLKNLDLINKGASFLKSDKNIYKNMSLDLSDYTKINNEDLNKDLKDRRVILIQDSFTTVKSKSLSMNYNLLKIIQYNKGQSESLSKTELSDYKKNSLGIKNDYVFLSQSKWSNLDSFWSWRERRTDHINAIFSMNENKNPEKLIGLHYQIIKNDRSINRREFAYYKQLFTEDLPSTITQNINWPDWYIKNKFRPAFQATLIKEIYFDAQLFKDKIAITDNDIRVQLVSIFEHRTDLRYNSVDIEKIPVLLSDWLSKKYTPKNEYDYLMLLIKNYPVLKKIGAELILKSLNADDLKKYVIVKINLTAEDKKNLSFIYPDSISDQKMTQYQYIISQNNVQNDHSYKLWLYFKPTGDLYSTQDILGLQ